MTTVAELEVLISADSGRLKDDLKKADKSIDDFQGTTQGKAAQVGRDIALGVGAAFVALAGQAFNMSVSFESAFAGVKKTVDGSAADLDQLRNTIREMATGPSPVSSLQNAHVELARIMELGGQLGIPIGGLKTFTETIAMLAMSTDLTADSAAAMMAQFANVTKMPVADYSRFGATIVDLGNNMATTESSIMEFAQRISVSASQVGMSVPDILAFSAALGSLGFNPEMASTAFSETLNGITMFVAQGGKELQTLAKVSGTSADEFAAKWGTDATGALMDFLGGLGQMNAADQIATLESLGITGSRQVSVLRALAGSTDLVSNSLGIANTAWQENTALMDEASKRAETSESRMTKAQNKINDALITWGDRMKPAIAGAMDLAGALVDKLNEAAQAFDEDPTAFAGGTDFGSNIAKGLVDAFNSLPVILDQAKIALATWIVDVKARILDFVRDLRNRILDATKGTPFELDIAPNIGSLTLDSDLQRSAIAMASALNAAVRTQVASGQPLDLNMPLQITPDVAMSMNDIISNVQQDPTGVLKEGIEMFFGESGMSAINDAIQQAIASGDTTGAQMLIPLAEMLDVDTTGLHEMLASKMQMALSGGGDGLTAGFGSGIPGAAPPTEGQGGGGLMTLVPVSPQLEIDPAPVTTQVDFAISSAASAEVFQATADVDLALNVTVSGNPIGGAISALLASSAMLSPASGPGSMFDSFRNNPGAAGSGAGVKSPAPALPGFADGGIYRNPGGSGLAWLHDGERVLTPEQQKAGRGGDTYIVSSYGTNPHNLVRQIKRAQRDMAGAR